MQASENSVRFSAIRHGWRSLEQSLDGALHLSTVYLWCYSGMQPSGSRCHGDREIGLPVHVVRGA